MGLKPAFYLFMNHEIGLLAQIPPLYSHERLLLIGIIVRKHGADQYYLDKVRLSWLILIVTELCVERVSRSIEQDTVSN